MPVVFVSYSHDSAEHSHRVLQFTEALRSHGIEAAIDVDVVRPPHGWPHWCEEQLRPENADFVLLICTKVYCDRVENKVAFDEGRGAFWEGSIIYDYVYEERGNQRFIPLLLGGATKSCIPRPIRNHTHYAIDHYDFTDRGYRKLYRELTKQNAGRKPAGEVVHLDSTYPGVALSQLLSGASPLVAGDAEPTKSYENVAERSGRKRWTLLVLLVLLFIAAMAALLVSSRRERRFSIASSMLA